jgi:uncharacterized protein (TIGR02246 family)
MLPANNIPPLRYFNVTTKNIPATTFQFTATIFLLLTAACQNNANNQTSINTNQNKKEMNTTAEKMDIEKLMASYGEALNASDVSKTVALFTKDGINMPNGAPLSKGQEQLKAAYEGLYKAFQLNVEYFTDEVIENGDYAYVRTNSKGTTLIHASGVTIPVENKELFVLHKDNGQWKISHYIFNNNKMK